MGWEKLQRRGHEEVFLWVRGGSFQHAQREGGTSYLVLIVGHCSLTARGVAEVTSPAGSIFLSSILVR